MNERQHNLVETRDIGRELVAMCACSWQSEPVTSQESAADAYQEHLERAMDSAGRPESDHAREVF